MNEEHARNLCLKLMKSDKEDEVINILTKEGLWDDDSSWRYYGDIENNIATIGNQMSRPEAALVEKLVNSVDARLINECLIRGDELEGLRLLKRYEKQLPLILKIIPIPALQGLWQNGQITSELKLQKESPCFPPALGQERAILVLTLRIVAKDRLPMRCPIRYFRS